MFKCSVKVSSDCTENKEVKLSMCHYFGNVLVEMNVLYPLRTAAVISWGHPIPNILVLTKTFAYRSKLFAVHH